MSKAPPVPPAQRERHDPHPNSEEALRGASSPPHPKAGEEANRRDNLSHARRQVQDR